MNHIAVALIIDGNPQGNCNIDTRSYAFFQDADYGSNLNSAELYLKRNVLPHLMYDQHKQVAVFRLHREYRIEPPPKGSVILTVKEQYPNGDFLPLTQETLR